MKILFYLLLVLNASFAKPATLDLSNIATERLTWKDVFDSGFHPWWRGNGEYKCHQSDVDISLQNGNSNFELTKGDIQFNLMEGYNLTLISHYGRENLTLDEARKRIEQFAQTFSNHKVKKGKVYQTNEGLGYNFFSSDINSAIFLENDKIVYTFSRSGIDEKPFVERFTLSAKSKVRKKLGLRVGGKVQPPKEYEHLSLDPYVVNKEYYDKLKKAYEESQKPEAIAEREKKEQEIQRIRNEILKKEGSPIQREPKPLPKTEPKADKPASFPWWLLGIVALVIVLGLMLFKGKSK